MPANAVTRAAAIVTLCATSGALLAPAGEAQAPVPPPLVATITTAPSASAKTGRVDLVVGCNMPCAVRLSGIVHIPALSPLLHTHFTVAPVSFTTAPLVTTHVDVILSAALQTALGRALDQGKHPTLTAHIRAAVGTGYVGVDRTVAFGP
jgi:hypothetical protein